MSKRAETRSLQVRERMRQRLIAIGAVTLVAVAIGGFLIWTNQPEIVEVPKVQPAQADGRSAGPADAKVTAPIAIRRWRLRSRTCRLRVSARLLIIYVSGFFVLTASEWYFTFCDGFCLQPCLNP